MNKLGLEAADLPWDPWELKVLDIIGKRIEEEQLDMLPQIVEAGSAKGMIEDRIFVNFVTNLWPILACAAKDVANELLHIRDEIEHAITQGKYCILLDVEKSDGRFARELV